VFRQPEAIIKQTTYVNFIFDESLEKFFKIFCKNLTEEANSSPKPRQIGDFVDYYGKKTAGYINY